MSTKGMTTGGPLRTLADGNEIPLLGLGVWQVPNGPETVNAVKWALDGHGILMRAEWDIAEYLADGRLIHVLPEYRTPGADIYAVYPQQLQMTARVKAFVDMLIAPVDLFDILDDAASFGAKRGDQKGDTRPDIGTAHRDTP